MTHSPEVGVSPLNDARESHGFNAQTGTYEDLLAAGVIDPTKVVRCALEAAASVAGLLLTTGAAIADRPDTHTPPPRRYGDSDF